MAVTGILLHDASGDRIANIFWLRVGSVEINPDRIGNRHHETGRRDQFDHQSGRILTSPQQMGAQHVLIQDLLHV